MAWQPSASPVPPCDQLGVTRAEWVALDRESELMEQMGADPFVGFALADQVESDRHRTRRAFSSPQIPLKQRYR